MPRTPHRSAPAVAFLACLLFGQVSLADVLVNGNFEDGPVIPQLYPIYPVAPSDGSLTGWTVTDGSIEIVTDNYWVPLSGHRSVALCSSGPGSIEQAFATSSGSIYRVTFWISGEPFTTPTIKNLRVTAGGTVQDFTFDNTAAWHWDMQWTQHTMDFTAGGASTTLRFSSMDASQYGPAIDSTKVELVSAGVAPSFALAFAPVSPDPVRVGARLDFTLASPARVRLAVLDIQGREVARLVDGERAAGPQHVELATRDQGMRPGLYLAVLQAGGRTLVRRFTVVP